MGKNKLERFRQNKKFANMFQPTYDELINGFPVKGKWHKDFFKNDNPIVLELGCGKGEYTIGLGKKYPNKNFIGIDIKGARIWRGCKTSIEDKMNNIAFLRTHIQMIEHCFAENEVDEIWITFPDPQKEKPNKRLTAVRFLGYYKKILKPNAILHLKTDSYELHKFTLDEVLIPGSHVIEFATDDLYHSNFKEDVISVQTFYESMYLAEGKKITYIQFRLNPKSPHFEKASNSKSTESL